jgi:hypothetical protein
MLEQVFKGMGVLDPSVADLRRPGTAEPFAQALRACMSGEAAPAAGGEAAAAPAAVVEPGGAGAPKPARQKLVQAGDGLDRRRAFGQLYEELGELAFRYYFVIPSYYILVMRSFVTLEGIALSADDDFNMYEATAPYAVRKLLTPRTQGGRALLRSAFLTTAGRQALRQALSARALAPLLRRLLQELNPLLRARHLLGAVGRRIGQARVSILEE